MSVTYQLFVLRQLESWLLLLHDWQHGLLICPGKTVTHQCSATITISKNIIARCATLTDATTHTFT
jgi:hypothetical protein